jgi:hypothetical protein
MAIYVVGYDLHEGQDYEDLISAIKKLGTWWHCLDSTWLVKSDSTAMEIRDYLLQHILDDDRLLVVGYGGGAAWYGFSQYKPECHDWLKSNL